MRTIEVTLGESLGQAATRAICIARVTNEQVIIRFNDLNIIAKGDSLIREIEESFLNELQIQEIARELEIPYVQLR